VATITIPIKIVQGERWGELSAHGPTLTHVVCGEITSQGMDFSFAGGHRVRTFKLKKNVHWKIPVGIELDISRVPPAEPPRRQGKRHAK
jgi:hypothetical protein